MAKVMVTGLAGFIGFHLGKRLLDRGDEDVGLDNLSPYYDVSLKEARLAQLGYERQETKAIHARQVHTEALPAGRIERGV